LQAVGLEESNQKLAGVAKRKTSYPSPADFESIGSKLSDVIELAESGDIGKA